MIILESEHNENELIQRWDERIKPSRFAGNDDAMDLYFSGYRNGRRIKLVRRSGISRDPFSAIFRGKINKTEEGSEIRGFFTKGYLDYIIVAFGLAFIFTIYMVVKSRGSSLTAINALLIASLFFAVLLLFVWRGSKKRYIEFLKDIL